MPISNTATLGIRVRDDGSLKTTQDVKRGLEEVSTAATRQDAILRQLAQANLAAMRAKQEDRNALTGLNKETREQSRTIIEAQGGMQRYVQILKELEAAEKGAADASGKATSAFQNVNLSAGQGTLSVGRLGNQFGTLIARMTGVPPVATNVLGVLGNFALGAGMMTGVLLGLAALSAGISALRRPFEEAERALKGLRGELDQFQQQLRGLTTGERLVEQLEVQLDKLTTTATRWRALQAAFQNVPGAGALGALGGFLGGRAERGIEDAQSLIGGAQAADAFERALAEANKKLDEEEAAQKRAAAAARRHREELEELERVLRRLPSVAETRTLGALGMGIADPRFGVLGLPTPPVGGITYDPRTGRPMTMDFESQQTRAISEAERRRQFERNLGFGFPMQESRGEWRLPEGTTERDLLRASEKQPPLLERIESAILNETTILNAAMIALGDKLLVGGTGVGSRVGAGLGSLLGGAVGQGVGAHLGKGAGGVMGSLIGSVVPVFGTIAGTVLGSALGGLFGSGKKLDQASDSVDRFRREIDRLTQGLHNAPAAFKREQWINEFTPPTLIPPRPGLPGTPEGGPSLPGVPILPPPSPNYTFTGDINISGVKDLESFSRELERHVESQLAAGRLM